MIHFATQHYRPSNPNRMEQLNACLAHNKGLGIFAQIILLMEASDEDAHTDSCRTIHLGRRSSFSDFLRLVSSPDYFDHHIVFSNSDLFMNEDVLLAADQLSSPSSVIALTRRELDGEFPPFHPGLSQDTWIMKGHSVDPLLLDTTNLALGIAGCENMFTAQLIAHGYNVWNPCLDIRTTHNDPAPDYNYMDCKRYHGFYAFPAPCHIQDVESSIPDYQFEFHPKT
ncbi:hypothetical protein H6G65_12815 [Microcystis elabens FACHB-917]|nr:hypothetical protein [Microcystis elabens FACHB-917]